MTIEEIKITDIVPADYNPRIMGEEEFNHLSRSIDEFGLVDPIIINLKNNHIIGGHQRYDVLLEEFLSDEEENATLKMFRLGDVGWCFTDDDLEIKSEDHEKALNIALNKISGDWDNPKLLKLLDDIDSDMFDVELIGFTDDEKDIIEFKVKEESVDKYSTGNKKVESGEKATFRIGKYKFKIPFDKYLIWKEEIENEAVNKNVSVESLLIEKLDLSFNLENEPDGCVDDGEN